MTQPKQYIAYRELLNAIKEGKNAWSFKIPIPSININIFMDFACTTRKIESLTLPPAYNIETHPCLPQLGESLKSAPSSLVGTFFAIFLCAACKLPSPSVFSNLVKV